MLNLLDWNNKIKVNGKIFSNSKEAYENFKDYTGELKIELNFIETSPRRIGDIKSEGDLYYY